MTLFWRADGRIHQAPAQEVLELREGTPTILEDVQVAPDAPHCITGVRAPSAHLQLTLEPGQGCTAAGIVLRPWLMPGSEAGSQPTAAILLVNWAESRLEVSRAPSDSQVSLILIPDYHSVCQTYPRSTWPRVCTAKPWKLCRI